MENLTNAFSNNLDKILTDNSKYFTRKTFSYAIGYGNDNSVKNALKGKSEPFWQKTCKCIEYFYANVPCFTLNDLIPTIDEKQEDKKSFAELEKDYKTLKSNYEQLEKQYNKLNQFADFINIIKTLSPERQDTLINLMSTECFANFLTKLREYSHRAMVFANGNKKPSSQHFFKPYDYLTFPFGDLLCQQTIFNLRQSYISNINNKTKEEWSSNRVEFKNDKINSIKENGKSRKGIKKQIENVNAKYDNIAYQYDIGYLKKKFGNINLDLTRWRFDPNNFDNNYLWDNSIFTYDKLIEQVDEDEQITTNNLPLRSRPPKLETKNSCDFSNYLRPDSPFLLEENTKQDNTNNLSDDIF